MDYSAEDNTSNNSLSFADLVCTTHQDHHQQQQQQQQSKQDPDEFEFISTPAKPNSSSIAHVHDHHLYKNNYKNSSSADDDDHMLINNVVSKNHHQLQLHEFFRQQTKQQQSSCNTQTQCINVSEKAGHDNKVVIKNQAKKKKKSFGMKLFDQLLSPCKECKTIQSTVKPHTRTHDVKLH